MRWDPFTRCWYPEPESDLPGRTHTARKQHVEATSSNSHETNDGGQRRNESSSMYHTRKENSDAVDSNQGWKLQARPQGEDPQPQDYLQTLRSSERLSGNTVQGTSTGFLRSLWRTISRSPSVRVNNGDNASTALARSSRWLDIQTPVAEEHSHSSIVAAIRCPRCGGVGTNPSPVPGGEQWSCARCGNTFTIPDDVVTSRYDYFRRSNSRRSNAGYRSRWSRLDHSRQERREEHRTDHIDPRKSSEDLRATHFNREVLPEEDRGSDRHQSPRGSAVSDHRQGFEEHRRETRSSRGIFDWESTGDFARRRTCIESRWREISASRSGWREI